MSFCCVCTQNFEQLVPLRSKDDSGIDYLSKLRCCVQQEIWKDHYLICNSCTIQLNSAYNFIKICLDNILFRNTNLLKEESETNLPKRQETFQCFNCSRSYKHKANLIAHIKKFHNKVRKKSGNEKGVDPVDIKKVEQAKVDEQAALNKDEEVIVEENTIKNENISEFKFKIEKLELIIEDDNIENDLVYITESPSENEEKNDLKTAKKERKPMKCNLCGDMFRTKNLWAAHLKEIHKDFKPYACDECDAHYLNAYSLLIHKRKHTNEKPFICSTCGKTFTSSADLYHHYKIHDNNRSYTCQICNKSYKTHSNLRTHRLQVHLDYEKWEFNCEICEKKFPIRGNLIKHMKRHAGIKDFACHICPKKFVNKAELTIHLNTHTNERHFKCQICFRTYKNREGLRRHMKVVHDLGNWKPVKPVKKYQCTQCPKIFAFSNKLQRHMYSHTGERPFICDFCPKRFIDTYGKRVHLKKDHPLEEYVQ